LDRSKVKLPRDFFGASLAKVEDEIRFWTARPGDHLLTPFQCANCQCQNIHRKNLTPRLVEDEAFEALCTLAYLDSFWAYATKTV
jgi:hypothetical protein